MDTAALRTRRLRSAADTLSSASASCTPRLERDCRMMSDWWKPSAGALKVLARRCDAGADKRCRRQGGRSYQRRIPARARGGRATLGCGRMSTGQSKGASGGRRWRRVRRVRWTAVSRGSGSDTRCKASAALPVGRVVHDTWKHPGMHGMWVAR